MTNILARVAASRASAHPEQFRPVSPEAFFALRLAEKLGEGAVAEHYAGLLDRYSIGQLLIAYRRAKASASPAGAARSFHGELERLSGRNGYEPDRRRLAAIRIERRAIAVVILSGTQL